MRIVIDMQGAQGPNEKRGIGKYTVAFTKALINQNENNEIILLFNGYYKNSISSINNQLVNCTNKFTTLTWYPIEIKIYNKNDNWEKSISEMILEEFVSSLNPDIFLISSVFEGFDNNITIVTSFENQKITTAMIFYDLIPLIYKDNYLVHLEAKQWYYENLLKIIKIDIHLCISENTKNSSSQYLNSDAGKIFNISSGVDSVFNIKNITIKEEEIIRNKYGLDKPFLMYTGGIDFRKNIHGFIKAFSNLSLNIKNNFQIAIVCAVSAEQKQQLISFVLENNLNTNQVIFTDYVSESDLISLYNLCTAFVFPSFYEGFGLPILEAMACGCAVIASNSSCIPEVIGNTDALFDPLQESSFTNKLEQILINDDFRKELQIHAVEQSKKFSWSLTAQLALKSLLSVKEKNILNINYKNKSKRKKLAFVSPLPPIKSGISDYSVDLLPELSIYYDIDLIINQTEVSDLRIVQNYNICSVDWFVANASSYDRIIYHIGNSEFHKHIFELSKLIPGIIVLHDFYLSLVLNHLDVNKIQENIWCEELYNSHGYVALIKEFNQFNKLHNWPCNYLFIQNSLGVISHSNYSIDLAAKFYKGINSEHFVKIPLLKKTAFIGIDEKKVVRERLKINNNSFVVCSFGFLSNHKLNHCLLDAWIDSNLVTQDNCILFFVGEVPNKEYLELMNNKINDLNIKSTIIITGWVDKDTYKDYLIAADVGVQLRGISTGETSAAVLDCMNYGLATIVNRNGTMDELDDDTVFKISDNFTNEELKNALEIIYQNCDLRINLKNNAQNYIHNFHNSQECASQYFQFIEKSYNSNLINIPNILKNITDKLGENSTQEQLRLLSNALDKAFEPLFKQEQILLNITDLSDSKLNDKSNDTLRKLILELLSNPPAGYRVEPVIKDMYSDSYYYARKLTLELLGFNTALLENSYVNVSETDIFINFDL